MKKYKSRLGNMRPLGDPTEFLDSVPDVYSTHALVKKHIVVKATKSSLCDKDQDPANEVTLNCVIDNIPEFTRNLINVHALDRRLFFWICEHGGPHRPVPSSSTYTLQCPQCHCPATLASES